MQGTSQLLETLKTQTGLSHPEEIEGELKALAVRLKQLDSANDDRRYFLRSAIEEDIEILQSFQAEYEALLKDGASAVAADAAAVVTAPSALGFVPVTADLPLSHSAFREKIPQVGAAIDILKASSPPELRAGAAKALGNLAHYRFGTSLGADHTSHQLISAAGGMKLLVDLLSDSIAEVRQEAVIALVKLADLEASRRQIVQLGGFTVLMGMLLDPDVTVQESVITALSKLIRFDEYGSFLAQHQARSQFMQLVSLFSAEDPHVRRGAVAVLGRVVSRDPHFMGLGWQKMVTVETFRLLAALLSDPAIDVICEAVSTLACFNFNATGYKLQADFIQAGGFEPLLSLLSHPDHKVQESALKALGRFSLTHDTIKLPVLEALTAVVRQGNRSGSSIESAEVVERLLVLVSDPNVNVQKDAAKMLGEHSLKKLVELLASRIVSVRQQAAWALMDYVRTHQASHSGKWQDQLTEADAISGLLPLLSDLDVAVQEQASLTLGLLAEDDEICKQIETAGGLKRLLEISLSPDEAIRVHASRALGNLHRLDGAVPRLLELLSDSSPRVRVEAVNGMHKFGRQEFAKVGSMKPVLALLLDSDAEVRNSAVGLVGHCLKDVADLSMRAIEEKSVAERAKKESGILTTISEFVFVPGLSFGDEEAVDKWLESSEIDHGEQEILEFLNALLASPVAEQRRAAVQVLDIAASFYNHGLGSSFTQGKIMLGFVSKGSFEIKALAGLLGDADFRVRLRAVKLLGFLSSLDHGRHTISAKIKAAIEFEALLNLIADPLEEVRGYAEHVLLDHLGTHKDHRQQLIGALITLLSDRRLSARRGAISALTRIYRLDDYHKRHVVLAGGIEALMPLLSDTDNQVRHAALSLIHTAAQIRSADPVKDLITALIANPHWEERAILLQVLAEFCRRDDNAQDSAFKEIMRLFSDSTIEVRETADAALAFLLEAGSGLTPKIMGWSPDLDLEARKLALKKLCDFAEKNHSTRDWRPYADQLFKLSLDADAEVAEMSSFLLLSEIGRDSRSHWFFERTEGLRLIVRSLLHSDSRLRAVAASALYNELAREDVVADTLQKQIAEAGVITLLLKVLSTDTDADVRKQVSETLALLASQERYVENKKQIIMPVCALLSDSSIEVRKAAVMLLAELAGYDENKKLIIAAGGIADLYRLLAGTDMTMQAYAADTLASLAYKNSEGQTLIVKTGGIEHLLDLLTVRDIQVQLSGIKALRPILEWSGANMVDGFLAPVLSSLSGVQEYAVWMFPSLTQNRQNQERVVAAGGLHSLARLLSEARFELRDQAVWVLANLAWNHHDIQKQIVEVCGIPSLCRLLGSANIEATIHLLSSLATQPAILSQMVVEGLIPRLEKTLEEPDWLSEKLKASINHLLTASRAHAGTTAVSVGVFGGAAMARSGAGYDPSDAAAP